jgi:GNAT superfamily N-acetyltransferase
LIRLRRGTLADAAEMAEVELSTALEAYADYFPEDAPKPDPPRLVQRWEERLRADERTAVFCAVDDDGDDADGAIVGTACGQPDPDQSGRGQLCSLYVRPALWGNGVGRRLHDAVVDHLRGQGFGVASLWVIEANAPTRARYERWGWHVKAGEQYVMPGIAEVRYELDLPPVTATSQLSKSQDHR